jgi:outer membrane protein assembly factor BamB
VALDVRTGEERWRADVASWDLVVLAGKVVLRGPGGLTAIHARTGAIVWEHEEPAPREGGDLLTDGRVVVTIARGDDSATLVARDVETGDERWRVASPLPGGSLRELPDGRLILSGERESVVLQP